VFAAGGAVRPGRVAVRAVADGRGAAVAIGAYLAGDAPARPRRRLSTHIGRLQEGEIQRFMEAASDAPRQAPAAGEGGGFADTEARAEARRCLHCDCRKADACRLRDFAELYDARPGRYKGQRRCFQQDATDPTVIYEPGKCIDCGICVRLCAEAGEPFGLAFLGRGFDVRVGVPFGRPLVESLGPLAAQCAAACPTGALAMKDGDFA